MKNKDIIEWMLDEGIDTLAKVNTKDGEIYLSDILAKHLIEQLRIHNVVGRNEQLKAFLEWFDKPERLLDHDELIRQYEEESL